MSRLPLWTLLIPCTLATAATSADDPPASANPPSSSATPDSPTETPAASADDTEAPADALAEWDRLRARKKEIAERLAALKQEFATADATRKTAIREEFGDLVDEYTLDVADRMQGLAARVLAARADDPEAAAILLARAFAENRFDRVVELAAIVERAGDDPGYAFDQVRRMAAVAHFATHDFDRAIALLESVEHQPNWAPSDALEKPVLLPAAREYVAHWKAEQALREREDALEGDERLPRVKFEIVDAAGQPQGEVEAVLFEDQAPNTVASFVKTVQDGGYDGSPFHRVVAASFLQTGRTEPRSNWAIDSEVFRDDSRKQFRYSLTTAVFPGSPDSAGSEFLITLLPTHRLNARTEGETRRGGNTVFGRVVSGMEVIDAVAREARIAKATMQHVRPHEYEPERKAATAAQPE